MKETKPAAYLWAFETTSWDTRNPNTISVGVFQFLPKASGKGFKRSKSIRVKGYGSAPQRVYQKAAELCALFNEKGVRAESPPDWVQKQYSVPKPWNRVEIKLDRNDGETVRRVRLQVV